MNIGQLLEKFNIIRHPLYRVVWSSNVPRVISTNDLKSIGITDKKYSGYRGVHVTSTPENWIKKLEDDDLVRFILYK